MPTIIGGKSGTRPYLELDWTVSSQDITNNRSRVNLKLYLRVEYSIGYSARYTGTLQGATFTSSSGYISSPGRYLLTERNVWINHNSDGTRTQKLTADYNLNITWSGTYYGKISLSGNANLGTIPRASTLSAFSFGAHLQPNTDVTINYTVDRKSGNFRHRVQLRDGSHVVTTWDNVSSNGASTLTLSGTRVNELLERMRNVTSRSLTLRIDTRSGVNGGWIGSAVARSATATVNANVKPSVGAVSVSQTGNTVSTHYLQGFSKINAEFTRTAGFGASIATSNITVRRKGTENDVQTISGPKGTTSRAVSLSGTYEAQGMARDSRGRTTYTAWKEFTVTAYESPRITTFTAIRSTVTPTTVSISRAGTHTPLGGKNALIFTVQRRTGTGSWTNVNTNPTGTDTTGSFSGASISTGNSVTTSYDFRMFVSDKFGEGAESIVSVSTQRVVLDVHKNEGVGIGKIHEQGVLDVDGDAYFHGPIHIPHIVSSAIGHEGNFNEANRTSFYHIGGHAANSPSSTWGFLYANASALDGGESRNLSQIFHERDGRQNLYSRAKSETVFGDWQMIAQVERGNNNNGHWVKFSDGTLLCYMVVENVGHASEIYFPHAFTGGYTFSVIANANQITAGYNSGTLKAKSFVLRFYSGTKTTSGQQIRVQAIGRWF